MAGTSKDQLDDIKLGDVWKGVVAPAQQQIRVTGFYDGYDSNWNVVSTVRYRLLPSDGRTYGVRWENFARPTAELVSRRKEPAVDDDIPF